MGFRVSLDEKSEELIRLIKSDPSKVFGSLYSAYMLFLIGEHDESELKWLLDNAKTLDSLTGNHVAYAVFAKQFKVKLHTHSAERERSPRTVGQIKLADIEDSRNISRLIKDGRFGMVVDGDELTAITYGTDLVASELGLVGRLPCVVIIDAIPAKNLCVIGLDKDVTSSLVAILRKAISEFQTSAGDTTIRHDAERLIGLQNLISSENTKDADLHAKIKSATETIEKFKAKIRKGSSSGYASHLEQILPKHESELQQLTVELDELPRTSPERLALLDIELHNAIVEHHRNRDLLFSKIFERHIKAKGLQKNLGIAKTSTLGYVGNLIKPETLLKIWELVSS